MQLGLHHAPALDRRLEPELRGLHRELLELEILDAQGFPAVENLVAPQLGLLHPEGRLMLVDGRLAALEGDGTGLQLRQDILVEEPAEHLPALHPVTRPDQALLDQARLVGTHQGRARIFDDALLQRDDLRRGGGPLPGDRPHADEGRRDQADNPWCSSHVSLIPSDLGGPSVRLLIRAEARLSIRPGHDPRGLILDPDRPSRIAGAAFDWGAAVTEVVIAITPVLAADPVDEHPEDGGPPDP